MSALKDAAFRVAVLTALRDAVAAEQEAARTEALVAITDAAEEMGVKSVDVCLPDGTKVATLSLAGGEGKPAVHDSAEFLAWVKDNHPTEVVTVERVRPAYEAAVLKAGGVDTTTGEMVPGVDVRPRTRYTSVRFATDGRDAVARAWRRGELQDVALPEIDGAA